MTMYLVRFNWMLLNDLPATDEKLFKNEKAAKEYFKCAVRDAKNSYPIFNKCAPEDLEIFEKENYFSIARKGKWSTSHNEICLRELKVEDEESEG